MKIRLQSLTRSRRRGSALAGIFLIIVACVLMIGFHMAHRKSDQVPSSDRKTQIVKGQQDSKQEQHKQAEEERKIS